MALVGATHFRQDAVGVGAPEHTRNLLAYEPFLNE